MFTWKGNRNGAGPVIEKNVTVSSLTLSAGALIRRNAGVVAAAADGTQVLGLAPNAVAAADTTADVIILKRGDILEGDYTGTATLTVGSFIDLESSLVMDGTDSGDGSDGLLRILEIDTTNSKMLVEFV